MHIQNVKFQNINPFAIFFFKYESAIYDYHLQYMRIEYITIEHQLNIMNFVSIGKSLITSGDIYIFNTLNFTSLLWKITISLYFLFDKKVLLRDCTLWSSYKFVIKISDYTHTHTHSYFEYRLFEQSYETFLIINKENEYRALYFAVQSSMTIIKVAFPCYLSKSHIIKLTTSYIVSFLVYIALKWLIIFKTLLTNCTCIYDLGKHPNRRATNGARHYSFIYLRIPLVR